MVLDRRNKLLSYSAIRLQEVIISYFASAGDTLDLAIGQNSRMPLFSIFDGLVAPAAASGL